MVHELTLEYQMAMELLLQEIHTRRMIGGDADEVCRHIVLADTDSLAVIDRIIKRTTGRVMIGMRAVAFEDAQDAIFFKLSS